MIITELAQHIQANNLGDFFPEAVGGDVFIESMPDSPSDAICLYGTGGRAADVKTTVGRPGVQIIVRGIALDDLRDRAWAIHQLFDRQHNTEFADSGGSHVMLCRALQSEPVYIGEDAKGRHRYSINLQLITGGI